jgi:hypothetical protein
MLEKLPESVGEVLRRQRAGLAPHRFLSAIESIRLGAAHGQKFRTQHRHAYSR